MPPLPQAATTGASIVVQPPNTMAQVQPEIGQSQQILKFCTLCTPVGRKCPNNYLSPNHPEWSEPEKEEDWDGEEQKEKERREKEQRKRAERT